MKVKPIPTSPKNRNKDKIIEELYNDKYIENIEKPRKNSRTPILTIIILSLLFGFFAGIIGNFILYIYGSQIPIINQLGINTFINQSFFVKKNQIEISNTDKINKIIDEISPSIVSIFNKKDIKIQDFSSIYLDSEKRGIGLFITSDGLIITTNQVVDDLKKDYVVITDNREILNVDEILTDPATDYIFLKVKTSNKTVIKLSNPSENQLGQNLYIIDKSPNTNEKTYFSTYIKNLNYHVDKNLIYSTDKYTNYILLDNNLFSKNSLAIVNDKNEIIGLLQTLNNETLVMPIYYTKSAIDMILKTNKISRPFLGINYLKIQESINIPENLTLGKKEGVLIYNFNENETSAITKNSPAEKAGFKNGDLIFAVGGTNIDSNNDLLNIIQNFSTGDILNFTILREGTEKNIKVELDTLSVKT